MKRNPSPRTRLLPRSLSLPKLERQVPRPTVSDLYTDRYAHDSEIRFDAARQFDTTHDYRHGRMQRLCVP